ncbi:MAG TPA: hypothetical protein DCE42_27080, partial [Myxococcales bacterium]|nr:hypothetical protein [Myxococcales bacterium]
DGTFVCKDGKEVCDIVDFANIRAKDKSIQMGSETTSPIHEDDEARTKVQFEYNYSLARAEVTQGQFKRLMGYNPSTNKNDNFPVSGVSWHEAAFYANELSKEQGLEQCFSCSGTFTKGTPYTGTCVVSQKYVNESDYAKFCPGFRLPTEAEWFYAYYAGNQLYKSFYSGNIESKANDCTEDDNTLKQIATFCSDKPTAIETHAPNDWNLYDMSGNVAEWVYDYYEKILESTNTNRVGPEVEKVAVKERVYKGGHFKSPPRECRGASRFKADPTTQDQTIGFRIARTLVE